MLKRNQKQVRVIDLGSFAAVVLLVFGSLAYSATINVEVKTDKAVYRPGDTVFWTIYAWASAGANRGVSLLSVHLDDDTDDTLNAPMTEAGQFTDTAYGTDEKYVIMGIGTPSAEPPELRDISVIQWNWDKVLDIGNDGSTDHIFATGVYVVSELGTHTLNVTYNGANYWPDAINNPLAFETLNSISTSFNVVLSADINADNYVDFLDFSLIVAKWPEGNCSATFNCDATDLNRDGFVNLPDIAIFASQWLACTDPANTFCDQFWK